MGQIFSRRWNPIASIIVIAVPLSPLIALWIGTAWSRSPFNTRAHFAIEQPVPFSHAHHVGGLGIDCRYCHTTAEHAPSAGMPPTETCMNCHSEIWTEAPMLAPVRQSYAEERPIRWTRVFDLPDFVYFDHSVHVNAGIGCDSCHGRIDQMPLVHKPRPLWMEWCLDCHRSPEKHVRPREEVYNMDWTQPPAPEFGRDLVRAYGIDTSGRLTDCTICHR